MLRESRLRATRLLFVGPRVVATSYTTGFAGSALLSLAGLPGLLWVGFGALLIFAPFVFGLVASVEDTEELGSELVLALVAVWAGGTVPLFAGGTSLGLALIWWPTLGLLCLVGVIITVLDVKPGLAFLGLVVLGVIGGEAGTQLQPSVRRAQLGLVENRLVDRGADHETEGLFMWVVMRPLGPDGGLGFAQDMTGVMTLEAVNSEWSEVTADPAACYALQDDWYWCGGDISPPSETIG